MSVGQIKQEANYGKNNMGAASGAQHICLVFSSLKDRLLSGKGHSSQNDF